MDKKSQTKCALVHIESNVCSLAVRLAVLQEIETLAVTNPLLYGFNESNIMIMSSHTHSSGGGYSYNWLYSSNCHKNCVKRNYESVYRGIVQSIVEAASGLSNGGKIYLSSGLLAGVTLNRSPYSYMLNPEAERAKYDSNVDEIIHMLKFVNEKEEPVASLTVFPIHAVSMPNKNALTSSDNVGYAAYLLEKEIAKRQNSDATSFIHGENSSFVALFSTSNHGDVSPNVLGAFCPGKTEKCNDLTSKCDDDMYASCHGKGAVADDYEESCASTGFSLFQKTLELFDDDDSAKPISGPIISAHRYTMMPGLEVSSVYTNTEKNQVLCEPSYGFSWAAGTTDGPAMTMLFHQGDTIGEFMGHSEIPDEVMQVIEEYASNEINSSTTFDWIFESLTAGPSENQKTCQHPKPILVTSEGFSESHGDSSFLPDVIPLQMIVFGDDFGFLVVPAEFSTMAGRRLVNKVSQALQNNVESLRLVFGNAYHGYVTTFEEYQAQRYEAASTIYGPHTLAAYTFLFIELAEYVSAGTSYSSLPTPNAGTCMDDGNDTPALSCHKEVVIRKQVKSIYRIGETARFEVEGGDAAASTLALDASHFAPPNFFVIKKNARAFLTDSDWHTRLVSPKRVPRTEPRRTAVEWRIAADTPIGELYSIALTIPDCHNSATTVVSSQFRVLAPKRDSSGSAGATRTVLLAVLIPGAVAGAACCAVVLAVLCFCVCCKGKAVDKSRVWQRARRFSLMRSRSKSDSEEEVIEEVELKEETKKKNFVVKLSLDDVDEKDVNFYWATQNDEDGFKLGELAFYAFLDVTSIEARENGVLSISIENDDDEICKNFVVSCVEIEFKEEFVKRLKEAHDDSEDDGSSSETEEEEESS